MYRGYLALWRKFQDHPFWKERREFSKAEAWIDLLWEVQHDENPQRVILGMKTLICNYGESLKSLDTWALRWLWSKSRVKRFFDLLVELNQIQIKNETITTRITILNYSQYDPKRNGNKTQSKRPRNDHETEVEPDKNVKNEKNVKNDKIYRDFFSSELMKRFLTHRKRKKAAISEDSYELFYNKFSEWDKLGYSNEFVVNKIIEKGWQSFDPEWVKKETGQTGFLSEKGQQTWNNIKDMDLTRLSRNAGSK